MFLIQKKWTVFPPWDKKEEVFSQFRSMEKVFSLEGDIISKSLQSEIFSQDIAGETYFVKRYFKIKGLGSWLGLSRLRVEARNQQYFQRIGVYSAPVIAYGEESFLSKTFKGVLITAGVEDVADLMFIANEHQHKFRDSLWRDAVITNLAQVVAILHSNRFCHNDLHWRNILIQQSKESSEPKVCLIDCPSGKRLFWPLLHYRKLKDLATLDKVAPIYLSQTQRLRFFLRYRKTDRLSAEDKAMIRDVFSHKANRAKRKAKQAKNK